MRILFWVLIISFTFSCGSEAVSVGEIEKAVEAFNEENYKQALLRLDQVLKKAPNNAPALLLKGRSLFNTGDKTAGIKFATKAIEAKKDFYKAYAYRAIMYSQGQQFEEAQQDIEAALKGDPENLNYLSEYGVIQQALGKHEKAVESFSKILKVDTRNESVFYFRGLSLEKLGRLDEAIDNFNAATLINPNVYDFRSSRGFTYLALKKYQDAFEDFNGCIILAQEANDVKQEAIAFNNRGFTLFKKGEVGKAFQDINHSLKLFDQNPYAYKNRGIVYIAQNQTKMACTDFQKALDLDYTKIYGNDVQELFDTNCK